MPLPNRYGALLGIILMSGLTDLQSQDIHFRHYFTDEGFTGSSFKTIVQDSLGFLWISSGAGLYKFDGYGFTAYKANAADSLSIPNDIVSKTWVDFRGRLWAGFSNCIAQYDRDLDGFIRYRPPQMSEVPRCLWVENDHSIWLGVGKGLLQYDPKGNKSQVFNLPGADAADRPLLINDIYPYETSLLLATSNGIWILTSDKKFEKVSANGQFPEGLNVLKVMQRVDHYWLWTSGGLYKTDLNFNILQFLDFSRLSNSPLKSKNQIDPGVRMVDAEATGTIWVVTQGLGLFRYDPQHDKLDNYRNDPGLPNSIPTNVLNHVMVDRDQNVWVSTIPKGIIQINKRSLQFYNYLPGKSITGVAMIDETHLIVGTNGSGLWYASLNKSLSDPMRFCKFNLSPDIDGSNGIVNLTTFRNTLLASTLQSGIIALNVNPATKLLENPPQQWAHVPDNPNTLSSNFIIGLYGDDRNGIIWTGSYDKGLNRIDLSIPFGLPGSVRHYHRYNLDDSTSLADDNSDSVTDILPLGDGSFLVGSFSGLGLFRNEQFTSLRNDISVIRLYRAKEGLLLIASKSGLYEGVSQQEPYSFSRVEAIGNTFITSIQEDMQGRFWLLTLEGVFLYDRKNNYVLQFKKEDGLPSSGGVAASRSAQTSKGLIIFANAEGVTLFDPQSLRVSNLRPRPVFTQLSINNKIVSGRISSTLNGSINTTPQLELNYTQNILTLAFAAMDLTFPEKNKYQFKLENFDKDWVDTDWKNRSATYTNLDPGTYTFKIRATNRDGVWSDHVRSLEIRVLPPPWKTWWAYLSYGIALAGALFQARRNIIRNERLVARLELEHLELKKVQELTLAKTDFFANISHEFRTPLTLIEGPAHNLLNKYPKDKDTVLQVGLIRKNAQRLLSLVNQILELARLESGSLKRETVNSDLVSGLESVIESFASLASQKHVSLVRRLPRKVINSSFDKDKLEKILANLLSNAIKFTPENGAIIINASVEPISSERYNLLVWVMDTGNGIPPDQLDRIFDRFYQVREDGSTNAGTGIGLSLCKELAEFLGGTLTVKSKVGEGSKFTLTLPIEIHEIGDIHPDAPTQDIDEIATTFAHDGNEYIERSEVFNNEKPLLLIVEDHADLRDFIIASLSKDYAFSTASNGAEGLLEAIRNCPTLIISDIMMPRMDGITMLNKVRKDVRTSHIPLILLTAKATKESKLIGLESGADDYLTKPFNKEELSLKVKNIISSRLKLREKIKLELLKESPKVEVLSTDQLFLLKLKDTIHKRLNDPQLGVDALTINMGMSRAQLYRKVSALTGLTVNDLIRTFRLERARQLLEQRWGTVSDVAYEVGFTNLSYFSKCFKTAYGKLPSAVSNILPRKAETT